MHFKPRAETLAHETEATSTEILCNSLSRSRLSDTARCFEGKSATQMEDRQSIVNLVRDI